MDKAITIRGIGTRAVTIMAPITKIVVRVETSTRVIALISLATRVTNFAMGADTMIATTIIDIAPVTVVISPTPTSMVILITSQTIGPIVAISPTPIETAILIIKQIGTITIKDPSLHLGMKRLPIIC